MTPLTSSSEGLIAISSIKKANSFVEITGEGGEGGGEKLDVEGMALVGNDGVIIYFYTAITMINTGADNGVRPRQKRRYEHRRTKRRNSEESRDWIFYATINCYRSTRSSLHCRARRWKRQLTITSLGLTGRWRVVLCLRETSRSLSPTNERTNEPIYLCSYYVQRYRACDCFFLFFSFFENKTLLFRIQFIHTIYFRGIFSEGDKRIEKNVNEREAKV